MLVGKHMSSQSCWDIHRWRWPNKLISIYLIRTWKTALVCWMVFGEFYACVKMKRLAFAGRFFCPITGRKRLYLAIFHRILTV